jgi:glycosyltransferase involved in cell wall biosynthesis
MKRRVGFLTTHPIQYQVPVFRRLAQREDWDFTVFYCQIPDAAMQGDGFGVAFQWDIPLLEGYEHRVLNNVSRRPSLTEFGGCDTPGIATILRKERFDALIVNGWVVKSCLQALWACQRTGTPCIVRGEANNLRRRAWWKRWLQRQLVRRYSAYLYIGEANRRFYKEHGVADSALFPARYCIENERFSRGATAELRQATRTQWELPESGTVFLYSGKLIEKKHPCELIRAFLAARLPETARLVVVGDGPLRSECESLAAGSNRIRFAGFLNQSEITAAYAAADVLVLPSDAGETWGLVVNEAMACGLPAVVSSLVGCAEDLVTPGVTGEVFPFGEWDSLSLAMETMAGRTQDEVERQRRAARERVAPYSPLAAAEGMVAAVDHVCTRRERRKAVGSWRK